MSFEVGRLSAALTLDGVDETTRGLGRVKAGFGEARTSAEGAAQGATTFSKGIRQMATQNASDLTLMGSAFTKLGLASAAAAGVALAKWANFDEAMSAVKAATHESESVMRELEQAAIQAGASTVFSATEAANAIEELAKAGVSTADILKGGLQGSLDLAAAGGLGVAQAAGIAATALQVFGLKGSDMSHVADLLAAGAGKAMGDVTDLSQALNQSSMIASQTGLSIEETTAALSAFASQGLLGSDAGTSFKTMLMQLSRETGPGAELMKKLGINAFDAQGKFVGLANFAGQLETKLATMNDAQRQAALGTIFGSDAIRAASVIYSEGASGIQDWINKVNDQGYAAETAAARLDNLKGDLEALGGALDTAFIQTGSGANEALRGMVQLLTQAVDAYNSLPAPLQSAILGVTLLAAGVGLLGGAFMKGAVQLAEFKAATVALGWSTAGLKTGLSSIGSFLTGPWGIALVAATTAAHMFSVALEDGRATTTQLESAIKNTANSADLLATAFQQSDTAKFWVGDFSKQLEELGSVLERTNGYSDGFVFMEGFADQEMINRIRDSGKALASVAESDAPAAQRAFADLAKTYKLTNDQAAMMLDRMPEFRDSLVKIADDMGVASDDSNLLKIALGEIGPAAEKSAAGTDQQISSLVELAGAAQSTGDNIKELSDQIKGFGESQFDVDEAASKLQDQYQKLTETLNAGGGALGLTTETGRETEQTLRDVASAANDSAGATLFLTGSQEKANAILKEAREKIVDARVALGDSKPEAIAWADSHVSSAAKVSDAMAQVKARLDQIPAERKIEIDADAASAYKSIEGVQVVQISDKTAVVVGDNESAMAKVREVQEAQTPEKVVQIDANAADAFAKIDGVNVVKIDGKTAYVYGNSNDAQAKIDGVIRKGIPGKTTVIGANSAGFWSAWTAIQLQQSITKTVDIITRTFSVDGGKKFAGGMVTPFYQGGKVQNFAAGGFPSGLYQGVVGGIPKAGLDGKTHIFAERELGVPWEVYLSGHPSYRERNIGLALEALKRMAFPVIPATALGGVRQFATGGGIPPAPAPAAPNAPVRSRFERRRRGDGPIVGTVHLGAGATRNDLRELEETLGDLLKEG
ncbi:MULTISPECIES: phage tail tape measure protein [unclassified Leucobacter]|uniref:phage tail tape measure protein n=1 Tax=unclassified Leucobacter TaxID=2621730 RepID=UPI000699B93D|nr:phage tail tape measure protein [Leucobacter sp. Ag1]